MRYRRKPFIAEVMRFDGTDKNMDDLSHFLGTDTLHVSYQDPMCPTLVFGSKIATKGWYIAKTELNEIFVISPCDFERDYERID